MPEIPGLCVLVRGKRVGDSGVLWRVGVFNLHVSYACFSSFVCVVAVLRSVFCDEATWYKGENSFEF